MLLSAVAALCAAALFAVAAALQHRSAGLITDANRLATTALPGFVARTLSHPLWIAGSAADLVGLGLHALALRDGPLTLVQPLLVSGVAFALPLRQVLEHRRPRRREVAWASALALGLALFLVVATPSNGTTQPPDPIPTVVAAATIGIGIVACFVIGRRSRGVPAAVSLGIATGLVYAAAAGLLKQTMDVSNAGLAPVFGSWALYALLAVGAAGLVINQLAFQAGPLRLSLPAITTIDPIVSVIVGVSVFDEHFRRAPLDLLGEALGLAVVVVAAIALTRSAPAAPTAPGSSCPTIGLRS